MIAQDEVEEKSRVATPAKDRKYKLQSSDTNKTGNNPKQRESHPEQDEEAGDSALNLNVCLISKEEQDSFNHLYFCFFFCLVQESFLILLREAAPAEGLYVVTGNVILEFQFPL